MSTLVVFLVWFVVSAVALIRARNGPIAARRRIALWVAFALFLINMYGMYGLYVMKR
jgi:hypothetical protein